MLQFTATDYILSGPVVKQNRGLKGCDGAQLLSPHGSQEAESEQKGEAG
jgi:hypothetical protein